MKLYTRHAKILARWLNINFKNFIKPLLNAAKFEEALLDLIKYVQQKRFGTAVELLKVNSADAFDSIIKKLSDKVSNADDMLDGISKLSKKT